MEVSIHNPDYPDGIVFDVGGIAIPNGSSVILEQDEVDLFQARNGITLEQAMRNNPFSPTFVERTPAVKNEEDDDNDNDDEYKGG